MAVTEHGGFRDSVQDAEYLLVATRNPDRAARHLAKRAEIPLSEARELIAQVLEGWKSEAANPEELKMIRAENGAFLRRIKVVAFDRGQLRTALDACLWQARFDGLDVSREVRVSAEVEHRHRIDLSGISDAVLKDHAINTGLRRALDRERREDDVLDAEFSESKVDDGAP